MGLRREDPFLLGDVLLEDVVLQRSPQHPPVDALLLSSHQQKGEENLRRSVDRHRHRHPIERDPGEERVHVVDRVDGDPAVAHLAPSHGVIGVVAHQGGHVEGHRQPMLTLLQQVVETLVGGRHVGESGELADRPQPAPVAGGVDAARVGELTGIPDVGVDRTVLRISQRR